MSSILVISGPSGAGKSSIIERAKGRIGDFYFSVSTTTREPRAGEVNGREYFFVSKEEFKKGIERGEFLEYAEVHGNYYGTSIKPVEKALKEGKLVIFDIDVQGFRLIRDRLSDILVSLFITPPTLKELESRLLSRDSDSKEVISKRLENAKREIQAINEYDFVVVNDNLDRAVEAFVSIANASRYKMSNQESREFIENWFSK
jgi:guanylate kinase